jgi:alkylation response protein AidB-like acyl-CoA dehydrogenase
VKVPKSALLGESLDAQGANLVWLYEHAVVATSIMQVSVCERAVQIACEYLTGRIQFGVPLGSFQAVQHRMADCYIDLESMRWTAWRAVLVLADGRGATREAMVAKFWAAEAGARITAAVQHLHGGIGIDLDYLVHRYFLWSKVLELQFGGGPETLARLGRNMAENPPQELS